MTPDKQLNKIMFETMLEHLRSAGTSTAGMLEAIRQADNILLIDDNLKQAGTQGETAIFSATQLKEMFTGLFDLLEYTEANLLRKEIRYTYYQALLFADLGSEATGQITIKNRRK